jgi:hypothetical protein
VTLPHAGISLLPTSPMTNRFQTTTRRTLAAVVLVLGAAAPASAQKQTMTVNAADSLSFIVPRRAPLESESSLRTRDRKVALVLRDTVVVLQLTDRGMDGLFDNDTTRRSGGEAIFARMMKAGVSGLMDHGIAYRLSALRTAYADGNRLVLEDRDGKHVFEDTELNGSHPMQDFAPGEAERFARAVKAAIESRR